ncbi:wax ester/triacylglycerol synthase family O-acyltransferase, partial [Escherichia coli]|nr:wax ester/triacylglycerol synthase family O-acyltransferase [Escherichia coli]
DQARRQAQFVPGLAKAIGETWKESLQHRHPELGSPFRAPLSLLNGKIGAQRRFATQHYDLARIRALAKRAKGTVNDVFLCLC